ncbi:hypothetical protein BU16DRAFT_555817 [Lophium mytilinum]|uniref:Uncharacterized protein n=1 Tax=Lophium mytilinum TaxID=390894 RepID=A0A6A6RAA2_9PEZI|nr:hypothetical protein BU16DRAFT_555817 [Lophium mytilinum]
MAPPLSKPDEHVAINKGIAAHLSQSEIAVLSCVSKYFRDNMEPYLYRHICITSNHERRLLSFFEAIMKNPKRAAFVRSFEFVREGLEELCVDEKEETEQDEEQHKLEGGNEENDKNNKQEDEVEEDEDDDLRSRYSSMRSIASANARAPAVEDLPGLTRTTTRGTNRSTSPTRSMSSVIQNRSDDGSDDGSDASSVGDATLGFSPGKGKQLVEAPHALTAANNHRVTQYKGQVLVKQYSKKQEPPRPTIFSSGSLPTSASCPDPTHPTLDLSKLWRRIQGAIHHAYPSLSATDINRWQAFLRANTRECRLGLLLQLMPNIESLKLDVTGRPSEWRLTVVAMTLGCQPVKLYDQVVGLHATGIQEWAKLKSLEIRGPGFNMRDFGGGRVVCRIRLPLHESLEKLRLFGVEATDVYIPGEVATEAHHRLHNMQHEYHIFKSVKLTDLELVNVGISAFHIENVVKLAKGLERLYIERLKHPYRFRVWKWSILDYEEMVDELLDVNPNLMPFVVELEALGLGVKLPVLPAIPGLEEAYELLKNAKFSMQVEALDLDVKLPALPTIPGLEEANELLKYAESNLQVQEHEAGGLYLFPNGH